MAICEEIVNAIDRTPEMSGILVPVPSWWKRLPYERVVYRMTGDGENKRWWLENSKPIDVLSLCSMRHPTFKSKEERFWPRFMVWPISASRPILTSWGDVHSRSGDVLYYSLPRTYPNLKESLRPSSLPPIMPGRIRGIYKEARKRSSGSDRICLLYQPDGWNEEIGVAADPALIVYRASLGWRCLAIWDENGAMRIIREFVSE